ncbi:MAG TPA: hypothetical protein VFT93_08425 [Candidatus Eisenbacteria bacterium]|nr:hypothetical protein [Candidatus Eisenbacteria bacterium]
MKTPYVRFRPRHGAVLAAILVALALSLAGCKGATEIKTLLDDPGRFDGTVVRVAGKVTTSVGLLGYGAYKLNDGTGTILVVSKHGVPREGAEVGVEGTFHSVFTFHDEAGAAIEEAARKER